MFDFRLADCSIPIRLSVACVAALLSPVANAAPQRVALLVGIDEYQRRGFDDLQCAESDVNELAAELRQLDFKVTILTGSGAGQSRATRENIVKALDTILQGVSKNDVVLLGLVGRGTQIDVSLGDGTRREDAFFCPVDAIMDEPSSMLSLDYLLDDVLRKRGGQNIVLVDASWNSAEQSGRSPASGIEGRLLKIPEDTSVFFSCRAGQRSFEDSESLNHGIFTYAVLKALRQAREQGGAIHWFDLVARISKNFALPEVVRAIPSHRIQEPILAGNMPDFVFAQGSGKAQNNAEPQPSVSIPKVDGLWKGKYNYPAQAARNPVPFDVLFVQQGETLTGFLREPNTFGKLGYPYLYASVEGRVDTDGTIAFRKNYDGTASIYHSVDYKGKLSGDVLRITSGSWSIPNEWNGTFTLEKMNAADAKKQSGVWNGTYFYQVGANQQPVDFQVYLFHSGDNFVGFIKEPNTFARVTTPWLYATVNGQMDPITRRFSFKKTYDGTGGEDHDVRYSGTLAADGARILDGQWQIDAQWGGTFALRRFFP